MKRSKSKSKGFGGLCELCEWQSRELAEVNGVEWQPCEDYARKFCKSVWKENKNQFRKDLEEQAAMVRKIKEGKEK